MLYHRIRPLHYKTTFLFFNEHFLSKIMCVVAILNMFAFGALSQENERENDLQRASLKSALSEFYPAENPISAFYIKREFEPFWIGNQKKLQMCTFIPLWRRSDNVDKVCVFHHYVSHIRPNNPSQETRSLLLTSKERRDLQQHLSK